MGDRFRSTRARALAIAFVVAIVAGVGYWVSQSGILDSATIFLRNENHLEVNVGIVGSTGDTSAFLGGDAVLVIPHWTEGTCPTASWVAGMGAHPVGAVLVAGGTRIATTNLSAFPSGGPYYVRIDVTGQIHTGEPIPIRPTECTEYQIRVQA